VKIELGDRLLRGGIRVFTRVNDERNSENLSVSIDVLGDVDWRALDSCRVGG
jgi:hypothetical protein